ncbi:Fic family protein [Chitinophaga sp. LS1]|uniref:Fic family protein n=1 Tax=Chitinophaga sp. LS1 TaxID=3051176 RepID=UPI002AAC1375|nr:Fic family protein [Chitinophaga sp. LS1]WPV70556.1 Fic family protein [Chitinophaga sp. LS1]
MGKFMGMINSASLNITPEILSLIAEIDEFKGAWRALGQLAPEQLSSLKKVATIESIGSSTRIEGSKLTDKQVEALLSNLEIQKFTTRDEQEVAGYSTVMNLLFQSYTEIPLSENYIQQMHSLLLKHSEKDNWHRGSYKKSPNHVEAFDSTGKSIGVVFETSSPFETPIRMQDLIEWATDAYATKSLHPLLVTAMAIVEFLAIHPFQDGNGRLSRILTTYLLLKEGYHYVPYSSLEAVIEQSKEGYYLALRQTQGTLKSESPDWQPWLLFFLRALQRQKRRLEAKVEKENLLLMQLPELSLQILQLVQSRGKATISDIVTITNANRNTTKKHLEMLVETKRLQKNGIGKGTWYTI